MQFYCTRKATHVFVDITKYTYSGNINYFKYVNMDKLCFNTLKRMVHCFLALENSIITYYKQLENLN